MKTVSHYAVAALLVAAVASSLSPAADPSPQRLENMGVHSVGDRSLISSLETLTLKLTQAQQQMGQEHPEVKQLRMQLNAVRSQLQSRLNAERELQQTHLRFSEELIKRRIAELQATRDSINKRSQQLDDPEVNFVMSPDALRLMAEKIGEAQIEHRLRELEATALIAALKESLERTPRSKNDMAELRLLERMLEIQKQQLERIRELNKKAAVTTREVSENELRVMELETKIQALVSQSSGKERINEQIADAATQQTASITMQKLLIDEARKINVLLKSSSQRVEMQTESSLIQEQVQLLKRQLLEVETQAESHNKELLRLQLLLRETEKLNPRPARKADSKKADKEE